MRLVALDGRVAPVTGSGQGVGQAIAGVFAEHGATAVFGDVVHGRAAGLMCPLPSLPHAAIR